MRDYSLDNTIYGPHSLGRVNGDLDRGHDLPTDYELFQQGLGPGGIFFNGYLLPPGIRLTDPPRHGGTNRWAPVDDNFPK